MAKTKAAHHRGTHQARARKIVDQANANPDARCWRCGRTLAEIRRRRPRARWTAGHVVAGQVDGELRAECSPCNYGHGATLGNRRRGRRVGLAPDPLNRSRTW